jgi:DNA-binding MarR family transcriptional regulator
MAASTKSAQSKDARELRLLNQYFPNADKLVFDKTKTGYVPMPILMRKAMRYLSAVELRVLVYLQTRCSKRSICFPPLDEIAHDLNLKGLKNLNPHIRKLEKKKFISTASAGGKKYFLVHDPAVAIAHMVEDGAVPVADLFEINELLDVLGRDPIVAVPKPPANKVTQINQAKGA